MVHVKPAPGSISRWIAVTNDKNPSADGPRRSPDDTDLDAQRRALGRSLDTLERERAERAPKQASPAEDAGSMGRLFRFSTEFISGIIAGAMLGWLFDHFLGTRPWGLIVFLLLGFLTGFYNLLKAVERERRNEAGGGTPSP